MKKVFIFLIILVFGLFLPVFTFAEMLEENPILPNFLMPSMIEGIGMHFEITDSKYLNIVLDSSEAVTLRLESVPEMVTMHIEPASETTLTQITIGGFQPSTTYYKYEDDYHNEVAFTTDGNGSYSWTQDLSQPHLVFIQPRKSTKFIADNATGGDCYLIGIWDSVTKTCTLTKDVYETIQIDSNYIILDGNEHTVAGASVGVYLPARIGVTIKNLTVKNLSNGIYLKSSSTNTLTDNTATSNYCRGITLDSSHSNTLTNNISEYSTHCQGIFLYNSNDNTLIGNTVSKNMYAYTFGIYLNSSGHNTLKDNTISDSDYGIESQYSNSNTFTGNTISDNKGLGIHLYYSDNNQIYNNNFINNGGSQALAVGRYGNIFNLEKPTGGNYWNNFDTPAEGCYDTNHDGFCDAPYRFFGGVDYLPWTRQSGWEIPSDTIPPTTTVTLSGTLGKNDWYISNTQVTLSASDNEGGSGVKEIHYILDGVETIITGSIANILIGTDGVHNLSYWAVDNAGNVEQAKTTEIKIDKTPPVITILGVTDGAIYALGLVPKASYRVTDATSGVATSSDSLTGGDGFELGTFTYSVTASDNAGNTATQTVTYTVIATVDGLIGLINQFLSSGDIDNEGIANSLLSKVTNALDAESSGNGQASDNIMQAFINQVEAQSGKHISGSAAAILINAAIYIINH